MNLFEKIKSGLLLCSLVSCLVAMALHPVVALAQAPLDGPGSGLVGWWKFDEGSGTTVIDSSGNGNTGTIIGNPQWTTGISGGGLRFNDPSDFIRIPNNSSLNAGVMTIAMWANVDNNLIKFASFWGWGRNRCADNYRAWWVGTTGEVHASYQNAADGINRSPVLSGAGLITLGKWDHYVFVYEGTSSSVSLTLYKNGVSTGFVYTNTDGLAACGQLTAIGSQEDLPNPGAVRTFPGIMDDFRVYNRALSASDVSNLYSQTKPGSTDTTAPSVPTNLRVSVANSYTINLSWSASSDNVGVAGYVIYRGGSPITVVRSATTYADTELNAAFYADPSFPLPNTTYRYTVAAFDAAGNFSAQSAAQTATTPAASSGSFTLTVARSGSGSDPVTSTPAAISCSNSSGTCSASFAAGSTVVLNPYPFIKGMTLPAPAFTGWSGSGCAGIGECIVFMDSDKSVTATYGSSGTDVTAPTVTSFSVPAYATGLTVTITSFVATDNVGVTGYIVTETSSTPSLSDSRWSTTAQTSYTFSSAGTKTLYAWAKDAAGNISSSRSAPVTIDLTLPQVLKFTIPSTSISLTVPILSFTAADNVGVTGYIVTETSSAPPLSDSRWSATAPASYTFTSAGTKTLYARVKDAVGNISSSLSAPVTITIGGSTTIDFQLGSEGASTASTPASAGTARAGYAKLAVNTGSNPYGIAVFKLRQNGVTVTEPGVPATPPTTRARVFIDYRTGVPAIPGRSASGLVDINTGIAVVNSGTATASITYTLRDLGGGPAASGTGTLAAGHYFARFINSLYEMASGFSLPLGFQMGSLEISSSNSQPLSVLALRGVTNQEGKFLITTTPVADMNDSLETTPIYFPQFADGGGYTTSVILLNTSGSTETGTMEIRDEAGNPVSVTSVGGVTNYSFGYSIPPNGVFRFQTDGAPAQASGGWVRVAPEPGSYTPVGSGVFNYNPDNVLYSESGIPAATPTTHARIYMDLSGNHNIGLAIANISPTSTANIAITAYAMDGITPAGTSQGSIPLVGYGYRARFADSFISGLPSGFTGVLDVSSATSFVVLTLRSLNNELSRFLMTTFPVADETQIPSAAIVFPDIVDGGGYQTEFILIGSGSASGSTLSIYDENGTPFAW
jgi:chitinase